jgi:hypothetical protein
MYNQNLPSRTNWNAPHSSYLLPHSCSRNLIHMHQNSTGAHAKASPLWHKPYIHGDMPTTDRYLRLNDRRHSMSSHCIARREHIDIVKSSVCERSFETLSNVQFWEFPLKHQAVRKKILNPSIRSTCNWSTFSFLNNFNARKPLLSQSPWNKWPV